MTESEILNKRIETAKRRYKDALSFAISILNYELDSVEFHSYCETNSLSGLSELTRVGGELNALLFLKDQIENQSR
jgi:hypothetical protein